MTSANDKMILILGVTASGKSAVAFELARAIDAEIVSIDSMKIYRRMDIGTAKPPVEKRQQIPYHLIDIVEPSESFSVAAYLQAAQHAISDIQARGKPVVAVGGTALYIKALLYGLFEGPGSDPEIRKQLKAEAQQPSGLNTLHAKLSQVDPQAAERIHPNDEKRIIRALEVFELTGRPISSFQTQWEGEGQLLYPWTIIGLRREKDIENHRMNMRVKRMIEQGLVEEVRSLLAEEKPLSDQARCAIGYAEIIDHLAGEMPLGEAIELIKRNTRKFAKSQRTWFKTFGGVQWMDIGEDNTAVTVLERLIEHLRL